MNHKDLDLVFTFARSTDNRSTNLLFSSLNNNDIYKQDLLGAITRDPLYKKIMGEYSILYLYDDDPLPVILATNEIAERVGADLLEYSTDTDSELTLVNNGNPIKVVNAKDIYYNCHHTCKIAVGCQECLSSFLGINSRCPVHLLAKQFSENSDEVLVPVATNKLLKSRKSKIGPFVYVSPQLTYGRTNYRIGAVDNFRTVGHHDFSYVPENAEELSIRSKEAGNTHSRLAAVKKGLCSICFVKEGCHASNDHKGYRRNTITYCNGSYPATEEEAVEQILKKYPPKMPYEEMSLLLHNSGHLTKKFHRRDCYASFDLTPIGEYPYLRDTPLAFVIRSRRSNQSSRGVYTCENYDETLKLLEKYKGEIQEPSWKIDDRTYALLMELVHHRHSPVRRGIWHTRPYPRILIKPYYYQPGFEMVFTYTARNSFRQLPWKLDVRGFDTLQRHYGLKLLDRNEKLQDEVIRRWRDRSQDKHSLPPPEQCLLPSVQ